jgi:SAM-dependent methyltransferase
MPAIGYLDSPSTKTLDRSLVLFGGWALDSGHPVARVEVVLDQTTVIPARLGIERPDVLGNLRLPEGAMSCGWAVTADLAPWPAGDLSVQVIVEGASGARSTIVDTTLSLRESAHKGDIEDPGERPLPAPSWPWELPEFLAEVSDQVNEAMSPQERMPTDDSYLEVGRSALKAIRFAQLAAGKRDFGTLLDMPCGHGRVLRWLTAAYPQARLTACDLLTDGVDFCAATFGATPVYSSQLPSLDAFADRYDLIFVGSLLTHVDVRHWDHLIALWHDLLNPDGLLVVTTHGELAAERMRAGHNYGYPPAAVLRTLRAYEHAGFAFLEEPPDNIDYGITLARPDWTIGRLLKHPDFRLVMYGEAQWHQHQDVAAVVRRPLRPAD